MLKYSLARLAQGFLALVVVVSLVFFLARLSGDPVALLAPPDATPQQLAEVRSSLGLDEPILSQYADYMGGLVRGDLGHSVSYSAPVSSIVAPAMVNTAQLVAVAFGFAVVGGVALGSIAGFHARSRRDAAVRMASVLGQSLPSFWLGMLLVLLFSVTLDWLPAFGSDGLSSYILPASALAAFPMAAIARLTRSAVVEVVGHDQITFLRAKGVAPQILFLHVLRNASLPVVTLAGIQLGAMFSGTIVIENLFAWPGVGQLAIQGIQARDFALIQGIVIMNTLVFAALLFLVDLSYGMLDPRVRRVAHASAGA